MRRTPHGGQRKTFVSYGTHPGCWFTEAPVLPDTLLGMALRPMKPIRQRRAKVERQA